MIGCRQEAQLVRVQILAFVAYVVSFCHRPSDENPEGYTEGSQFLPSLDHFSPANVEAAFGGHFYSNTVAKNGCAEKGPCALRAKRRMFRVAVQSGFSGELFGVAPEEFLEFLELGFLLLSNGAVRGPFGRFQGGHQLAEVTPHLVVAVIEDMVDEFLLLQLAAVCRRRAAHGFEFGEELSDVFRVFLLPFAVARELHSKAQLLLILQGLAVHVACNHMVCDCKHFPAICRDFVLTAGADAKRCQGLVQIHHGIALMKSYILGFYLPLPLPLHRHIQIVAACLVQQFLLLSHSSTFRRTNCTRRRRCHLQYLPEGEAATAADAAGALRL
ncbi:hypothetical protein L7F22_004211 [Adiantum nelumboides]|nr:hypothetical protein [Adiantum nelumboides]